MLFDLEDAWREASRGMRRMAAAITGVPIDAIGRQISKAFAVDTRG
ncbi:MAG TPA: hypothetical protein VFZ53_26540 [Polyangiaceae bacterium]